MSKWLFSSAQGLVGQQSTLNLLSNHPISISGVTPFASILKHIWYRQKKGSLKSLRRVEFFWVCRDAPSFGWFQSLLQEVEAAQADREWFFFSSAKNFFWWHQPIHSANFLRINVYLTQKIDENMLWNIAVNDAGAEYDPLTLLRSRTMYGRPDWMSIYGQMKQAIESGQYIPGSNAQLKSKVGVRKFFQSLWGFDPC
jgi:NADPH oxidase